MAPLRQSGAGVIDWVSIHGGAFLMGSDGGPGNEKPVHRVNVEDFEIARTLVTNKQYRACVEAGACASPEARCMDFMFGGDDQPVVCVNWSQAQAFAEWTGGRLPTEAEWEYAARGTGKDQEYPWGNERPTCERAAMDDGCSGCGRRATSPVCSRPQGNTDEGLCDMGGNAWQWVQDRYHSSYQGAPDDASAWERSGFHRVLRGGSWSSPAPHLRAATRYSADPGARFDYVGFRPARRLR